jgi:S-methylmethionine-dependent homocysteine/selenocysteine methylase
MLDPVATDGVVVLDGGMGTELEARGARMDYEAWSGLANLDDPDLVRRIHEDYIRAGADVVIANTFPTNRSALAAAGYGDRFEEANRAAVDIALSAREQVGRPVAVAGSMSLLGTVDGERNARESPPEEQLLDVYGEQAALLADAGVDLIMLEMFDARWSAALRPALDTGLPVWVGAWTRLGEGGELVAATGRRFEQDLPALIDDRIAAVLVMHSPLAAVRPALAAIARHWRGPRGAYPHAGHWERPNWKFEHLAPSVMADHAKEWVREGARIVGGCCGTRPDHIRAIHDRLAAPPATRNDRR